MLTLLLIQTLPTFATPGTQSHAIVATALGVLARRDFSATSPDLGFRVDLLEVDSDCATFKVTAKGPVANEPIATTLVIPTTMFQTERGGSKDRYIN